jgi:acetoacetyl-CoA synthetase
MDNYLWEPEQERRAKTNMIKFIQLVNSKYGHNFQDYQDLYQWSVENISEFWALVWEFTGIKSSSDYINVVENMEDMFNSTWFEGASLNFAENLLRYQDDRVAIVFKGENKITKRLTYRELYQQVARLSNGLKQAGVTAGDRVAGFMPNMAETVIAMLAATSIGAIWSSCSPDFGFQGVMDRFGQIQPKILFTANGYYYNGKEFDSLAKAAQIAEKISTVEKVVVVPYTQENPDISWVKNSILFEDFMTGKGAEEIEFAQLPFEYPLYIMYSSGTTGVPKCIVHGAGGTLVQHLKELVLHTDLTREDTIFYYTTCGWMMWNWQVSSLAVGATLVLFDGSPFYPDAGLLFKMAEEEQVTVFGTSAKYIAAIEQAGLKPKEEFNLSPLKAILSTGSPLTTESFYKEVPNQLSANQL